jgi:hypothetical protein
MELRENRLKPSISSTDDFTFARLQAVTHTS